jgi:hypothetical protein
MSLSPIRAIIASFAISLVLSLIAVASAFADTPPGSWP